jgi:hypothetical protein
MLASVYVVFIYLNFRKLALLSPSGDRLFFVKISGYASMITVSLGGPGVVMVVSKRVFTEMNGRTVLVGSTYVPSESPLQSPYCST